MRVFLLILSLPLLSSCAFFSALSFQEDKERSGKLADQEVLIQIHGARAGSVLQDTFLERQNVRILSEQAHEIVVTDRTSSDTISIALPPDTGLEQLCKGTPEKPPENVIEFMGGIGVGEDGVAIVSGVGSILITEVNRAIGGYIENKKKTFTNTYGSRAILENAVLFGMAPDTGLEIRCIDVIRRITLPDAEGLHIASRVIFSIVARDSFYQVKPVYVAIPYAAAMTGHKQPVKLLSSVQFAVPVEGRRGKAFKQVFNYTFSFPKIAPRDDPRTRFDKLDASVPFLWPAEGPEPVVIFVKQTEYGTGADEFARAEKSFETIGDELGKAIEKIIDNELEEAQE